MAETVYEVKGFRGSAVEAGLKKHGGLDLGLIVSDGVCTAAGAFTTNKVKAAPVLLCREHLAKGAVRAIVANAGNANACTGTQGMEDAYGTARLVAREIGCGPEEVLVASTGVIGRPMDMGAVTGAVPGLAKALSPGGLSLMARAIMTTDTFPKLVGFEGKAGGRPYKIVGMAKGAGMIMPNMATMLCFVLTDLAVEREVLKEALSLATEGSFNRITIDGDTSTNDMALLLANGAAENPPLTGEEREVFAKGLGKVLGTLAEKIVEDGEGATKFIRLTVKGAGSPSEAQRAARSVANSNLVKTAFFGQDANWGRIMAALGRTDIHMEEDRVRIWVDQVQIVSGGLGLGAEAEALAAARMANRSFDVTVDLGVGEAEDRILTCDFSEAYVRINAGYRT